MNTIQLHKPFLKWPGAKTKLVGEIIEEIIHSCPSNPTRFIEPFFGSGTVFYNLWNNMPEIFLREPLLGDYNNDLASLYSEVKDNLQNLSTEIFQLFSNTNNTRDSYDSLRREFNGVGVSSVRRAALFIYLNRHCFNGLCRYNSKSKFNVPFGKYKEPYCPLFEITQFSNALQITNARVLNSDFRAVLSQAGDGDFVYCDPPYLPLNQTSHFTAYAAGGFSASDHADLTQGAIEAVGKGAVVVISNHDTPQARALYQSASRLKSISVSRTISAKSQSRIAVSELMVTYLPN